MGEVGTFSQDVPEGKLVLSMKSSFGCIFMKKYLLLSKLG